MGREGMMYSSEKKMVKIGAFKWFAAIVLVVSMISCVTFPGAFRRFRQHLDEMLGYVPVATFGTYDFVGYDKFRRLEYEASAESNGHAIYVQIAGDAVYRLEDIEESVVSKAIPKRDNRLDMASSKSFFDDECIFVFKGRRLHAARISYSRDGLFKIGPTPEGPFREMPLEYSEVFEMFGKPDRWGRTRVITGP
jgi:hypothetical protein